MLSKFKFFLPLDCVLHVHVSGLQKTDIEKDFIHVIAN